MPLPKRAHNAREDAFTMIELLVVVIIIGILAAIAVPVYIGLQNNAKKRAIDSDVATTKLNLAAALSEDGAIANKIVNRNVTNQTSGQARVLFSGSPEDEVVTVLKLADGQNYTVTGKSKKLDYCVLYTSADGRTTTPTYGDCVTGDGSSGDPSDITGDPNLAWTPGSGTSAPDGTSSTGGGTPGGGNNDNPNDNPGGGGGNNTTTIDVGTLKAVANYSYNGPVKFMIGSAPLDYANDKYNYDLLPYTTGKTVQSDTTPVINGLSDSSPISTTITNVKIYNVSGGQKTTDTFGTCTFSASVSEYGADYSYQRGFTTDGGPGIVSGISCTDTTNDSIFPDTGYCSTDATTNDECGDPNYRVPANKFLKGGYITFTDGNGKANRINIASPFAYFFDS